MKKTFLLLIMITLITIEIFSQNHYNNDIWKKNQYNLGLTYTINTTLSYELLNKFFLKTSGISKEEARYYAFFSSALLNLGIMTIYENYIRKNENGLNSEAAICGISLSLLSIRISWDNPKLNTETKKIEAKRQMTDNGKKKSEARKNR